MTAEELVQIHEDYRRAIESARDESLSQETRDKAGADVIELRHKLDAALIEDKLEREDEARAAAVEARAAAARLAHGTVPERKCSFPEADIKALREGRANQLVYTIPIERRTTTVLTTVDTSSYSSYSIPQEWADMIYSFEIAESGVLAAGPKILSTASGEQINMPKTVTNPTATAGTEGVAPTNSTTYVLGTVPFNNYRIDGFIPLSDELLRDSGVNLEAYVREEAARALAAKKAAYLGDIDIGTGSNAPAAITVGVTSALTAASSTAVTPDELKQLMYSVLPAYRNGRTGAAWIANSAETLRLALAKDDNGNYIWQPSQVADEPDRLWGRPWFEDAYFDASASGNIPVVFGNVNRAYTVRNVGAIEVSFSRDFLFTNFAVTCRFAEWFDAATMDAIAVKGITLA